MAKLGRGLWGQRFYFSWKNDTSDEALLQPPYFMLEACKPVRDAALAKVAVPGATGKVGGEAVARDGARHSSLPVLMLDGYWSCWGRAFAKARLQSLDAILARALLAPKLARAIQARAARRAQRERIQFLN